MSTSYVSGFHKDGLLKMHLAVINALKADDATPPGQEKIYGVRTYPDWRKWSDSLEAELTERNVQFNKVPW
jgi:hypothetical protein